MKVPKKKGTSRSVVLFSPSPRPKKKKKKKKKGVVRPTLTEKKKKIRNTKKKPKKKATKEKKNKASSINKKNKTICKHVRKPLLRCSASPTDKTPQKKPENCGQIDDIELLKLDEHRC